MMGTNAYRYTNVVGPYVSCLAGCLKDSDVEVRRKAFTSMSRLLQEDYLKLKGVLFYRFISVVIDDDRSMSELGTFTPPLPRLLEPSRNITILHYRHWANNILSGNELYHAAS